ncbi:MAG: ParB/RepB/Spo0J family partition protein [Bacteroidota bacterium]
MSTKETIQRKSALGRGLNVLLKDSSYFTDQEAANALQEIPIDQIEVNPLQPRKDFNQEALQELSESMKVHGVIQPLTVRKLGPVKYQLIAGERRLQAAKQAGLQRLPAYIRTANDQQMLEMALVENIQRENLNPIEIALSYQRLLTECKIKQEALGSRVGKNRATVNNYLRLLKLPPDIQLALRDQKISMGHARALINVETTTAQLGILKEIIQQDLSVRKVEELARSFLHNKPKKPSKRKQADHNFAESIQYISTKLTTRLGTSVRIRTYAQEKGEISIAFTDAKDLHRITQILAV